MYQDQLGPSGGIYYPNFARCFVVLYLNSCKPKHVLLFRKLILIVHFKMRHVTKQDLFIFRNFVVLEYAYAVLDPNLNLHFLWFNFLMMPLFRRHGPGPSLGIQKYIKMK